MNKSPCTFCPYEKKFEACHDTCKDYIYWKQEREKVIQKEKEDKRQYRSNNIVAFLFNRKSK